MIISAILAVVRAGFGWLSAPTIPVMIFYCRNKAFVFTSWKLTDSCMPSRGHSTVFTRRSIALQVLRRSDGIWSRRIKYGREILDIQGMRDTANFIEMWDTTWT